ncbi:MAG: 50S ribosomal protein L1 [Chloroflexota bacterium]|nr:50S ribosomal protein L1 [Chloroflexota bacterium]
MPKHGKNYREALKLVDRDKLYSLERAIELAQKTSYVKFDATVEAHIRLGVDPRHADQQVRGVVMLPYGTGQEVRILVFAEGEAAKIAEEAGADYVGSDELIAKIKKGWLDFDVAIAVPQVMSKVSRLGRILGPRGLMPNPKAGTLVSPDDLPRVIKELHLGRIEFRIDKTANLHVPIGKVSFSQEKLAGNLAALLDAVKRAKPASAKGQYIKKIVLTTTMGPGIKLDTSEVLAMQAA